VAQPDRIKVCHFGNLPNGENVEEYTLTNTHGLTLKILTYGGIINELHVPDRHGITADVVLGFNNLAGYLGPHPYFGAIVGRVAGRITRGRFTLDGRNYRLVINNPPNHLHGGAVGFDKRLWKAQTVVTAENVPGMRLTYRSPHSEEGYPGNVDAAVTYSLTDADEVVIHYEAVTDQATPLSLTNHSYFNLAGEGNGTIEDHILQVASSEIAQTDEQLTLLGVRVPVVGKANDFNRPKRLGDAIPFLLKNHGDLYLLPPPARKSLVRVARVEEPASDRVMEVLTTEDCLQVYTSVFLDGSLVGKSGRAYAKFGGLALECEGYPDGVNHPGMGDIILRPGETYQHTTIYRFKTT
jgi:aldose 1-epimerase